MTNEEAIKWIERFELAFPLPIEDYIDAKEALDMAIKALDQEDVLEKIRAEIEQNAYPIVGKFNNIEKGMTLYGILQVIDKYKAESEDKNAN